MLLHAAREGRRHEEGLEAAFRSMTELSREAADTLRTFEPNAVTDVTGFGLLGHAHEMAERSGVRIELDAGALPLFPGAREQAAAGIRTGGDRRNRDFAGPHVDADAVPEDLLALAYDPQTSGGLLVSLPADKALVVQAQFESQGLSAWRVGRVVDGSGVVLRGPGSAAEDGA
jgi:selenide,water dikinase